MPQELHRDAGPVGPALQQITVRSITKRRNAAQAPHHQSDGCTTHEAHVHGLELRVADPPLLTRVLNHRSLGPGLVPRLGRVQCGVEHRVQRGTRCEVHEGLLIGEQRHLDGDVLVRLLLGPSEAHHVNVAVQQTMCECHGGDHSPGLLLSSLEEFPSNVEKHLPCSKDLKSVPLGHVQGEFRRKGELRKLETPGLGDVDSLAKVVRASLQCATAGNARRATTPNAKGRIGTVLVERLKVLEDPCALSADLERLMCV